jgi:ribosomal protein S18 acetylase RimI-like enzyme
MTFSVRRLVAADVEDFQALRLRGLAECPTAFASSLAEECDRALPAVAQRLEPVPGRAVLGAFDVAVLAGMIGVQRESRAKLAHKVFVWGMYVAPEFRRRRVGRLLVDAALKEAYAMPGVARINLGVNASNVAAIALYEGAGFARFGLEHDFMRVDGVAHDELHMVHERVARPAG